MSRLIIVVDRHSDWQPYYPSEDVVTFDQYLRMEKSPEDRPQTRMDSSGGSPKGKRIRVINLCRQYKYLSRGYYCSLLAEARGHHVIPSVSTINNLARKSIFEYETGSNKASIHKHLKKLASMSNEELHSIGLQVTESKQQEGLPTNGIRVRSYFGKVQVPDLASAAAKIFEQFPVPIADLHLKLGENWSIDKVEPIGLNKLEEMEQSVFADQLDRFSSKIWRKARTKRKYRYDLAVLINPEEEFPPSDAKALKKVVQAANKQAVAVDFITRRDLGRVGEYDMLFIRETTAINNHTFRFAKKAEAEGLVVMDDSVSIMRCTNKVYLADLLATNNLPTPATRILSRGEGEVLENVGRELGYPLVLKIPDGSFSRGVSKVSNDDELRKAASVLFKQSSLLLAQEFMYTDYDWRIGVLNGKPLYACKYFMAEGHWQIYEHGESETASGNWETLPIEQAPSKVVSVAVKAANLIGKGLYGVDLKQSGSRIAVIEVNDNPSIEHDVEDRVMGTALYDAIISEFIRRVESRKG